MSSGTSTYLATKSLLRRRLELVEGERKAVFEDCENEKRDNKERIK